MNERRQWAAALTIMFTLLCMVILFAPGAVAEFINWSHFDALWADHGLGSSGPVIVDVPTAQLTATPAMRVRNLAADGNSFEAQNASATPVWQIDKDGNVTAASLTTTGAASAGTDMTIGDKLSLAEQAVITVTTDMEISPAGVNQVLACGGDVGTSNVTAGNTGDVVVLYNRSNCTITLTDTGTLKLSGNAAMGQYDSIILKSDGTNWIQIGESDN